MFSIVIVNYDGMKYLPQCLQAIRRQIYEGGYEIIVVNNRSSDGSVEYLRQQADVNLIDPDTNTGFSRGQNLGILAAKGRYVLCLNFDCLLEPDFLKHVAAVFESRPQVASVSGKLRKLVKGERTEHLDSTGIAFHHYMPCDRGEWRVDGPAWSAPGPIFGPSGAAACYRKEALEKVRFQDEYFDEDFFIYCEDIDLAWRLNLAQCEGWYEPRALAYHERGSTRKKDAWERRRYFVLGFRNRLLAMYKNLRWRQDVRPDFWGIVLRELKFSLGRCKGGIKATLIMMMAMLGFLRMVLFCKRLRLKRRAIQQNRSPHPLHLGLHLPSGAAEADLSLGGPANPGGRDAF